MTAKVEPLRPVTYLQEIEHPFRHLPENQIVQYIEEAIRLKNPSLLFIICQIPKEKFNALFEIDNLSGAFALSSNEDIKAFLEQASAEQLNVLCEALSIKKTLEIPLLKANIPNIDLSCKCYRKLICIPPFHLLLAIKSGMSLVALSRFLSPKQLRFLALHAPEKYITQVIAYLFENNHAAKLYIVLLALPEETVSDAYSFSLFAREFNAYLSRSKNELTSHLSEAKEIDAEITKKAVKAPITKFYLLKEKEKLKLENVNAVLEKFRSLSFDACVAAFKRAPQQLSCEVLEIDKLIKEISSLLLDFNNSPARTLI